MREFDKLKINRGGNIFTDTLIFERRDLFEKCPKTVQEAVLLYHQAISMMSVANYDQGRQLLNKAFETLQKGN